MLSRSGSFLDVPLVPGAVLVNIADLMQRWTSDRFVSAVSRCGLILKEAEKWDGDLTSAPHQPHRVLLPPAGDCSTRQSLAFFVQPDDDVVICCCDGSDKYPPVSAGVYLQQRLQPTYQSIWQRAGASDDQSKESSGGKL